VGGRKVQAITRSLFLTCHHALRRLAPTHHNFDDILNGLTIVCPNWASVSLQVIVGLAGHRRNGERERW
jgi:hypothetical protein